MIKKIAIIEPKNPELSIWTIFGLPRLGPTLLATIMRDHGYEAKSYYLYESEIYENKEMLSFDLIGISTITPTVRTCYDVADYFRSKGKKVVIGGSHVTFLQEEALEHADFCIMGEGEIPLPILVETLNNQGSLKDVPSLVWKNENNEIILNKMAPQVDLDTNPIPDLSLLDTGSSKMGISPFKVTPIQTTRGCPHNCTFCGVTAMFGRGFRHRSIPKIIEEMKMVNPKNRSFIRYKNAIFFYDDNFTANPNRVKELCKEIIRLKLKFRWLTQARADVAKDPELLELMVKAGCRALFIGFESIDPAALKEMNKNITADENIWYVKQIRKAGIYIHGMFVYGFDADTVESMQATTDFAIKEKIDSISIMMLSPVPGTEFFDKLKNENRIIDYDWNSFDGHHITILPKRISPWELLRAQMEENTRFYKLSRIIKGFLTFHLTTPIVRLYGHFQTKKIIKTYFQYIEDLKRFSDTIESQRNIIDKDFVYPKISDFNVLKNEKLTQ